jgi:hypothetical protein
VDFAPPPARLGVPPRVATDMLGHSRELMTISYQHASDSDRRGAADKVDRLPAWLTDTVGGWPMSAGRHAAWQNKDIAAPAAPLGHPTLRSRRRTLELRTVNFEPPRGLV